MVKCNRKTPDGKFCEFDVPENFKFCPECGNRLDGPSQVTDGISGQDNTEKPCSPLQDQPHGQSEKPTKDVADAEQKNTSDKRQTDIASEELNNVQQGGHYLLSKVYETSSVVLEAAKSGFGIFSVSQPKTDSSKQPASTVEEPDSKVANAEDGPNKRFKRSESIDQSMGEESRQAASVIDNSNNQTRNMDENANKSNNVTLILKHKESEKDNNEQEEPMDTDEAEESGSYVEQSTENKSNKTRQQTKLKNRKKEEEKKRERKERRNDRAREEMKREKEGNNVNSENSQTTDAEPTSSRVTRQSKNQDAKGVSVAGATQAKESLENIKEKDTKSNKKEMPVVYIDVHFNAIVSSSLLKNPQEDKVYVRFANQALGGPTSDKYEMKKLRIIDEDYTVYHRVVQIPKHMTHHTLYYNYYVVHKGEDLHEYFYDHYNKKREDTPRELNVLGKNTYRGTCYQYDGVVNAKIEDNQFAIFKKIKNWVGKDKFENLLKEELEKSLHEFFPKLPQKDIEVLSSAEEVISQLNILIEGLQYVYSTNAKLWTGEDFKKSISKVLKNILEETIEKFQKQPLESHLLRLANGIVMVCMTQVHSIDLNHRSVTNLCRMILMEPNFEKKTYMEFNELKKMFPETKLQEVRKHLQTFCNSIVNNTKNPCWLYCAPLLHFLGGKCQPFETVKPTISHDAREAHWWGIAEYHRAIENFKQRTHDWTIPLKKVIEILRPLFLVDYFLPRTLMSVLRLSEIEEAISTKSIPNEIAFASLYFYIKTDSYNFSPHHCQTVLTCLTIFVSQYQSEIDIPVDDLSPNIYQHECMRYNVSAQLMNIAMWNLRTQPDIILYAVQVFLLAISQFDRIHNAIAEKERYKGHMSFFSDQRRGILNWLEGLYWTYPYNTLMIWNTVLSLKLPAGTIQRVIVEEFSSRLQRNMGIYLQKYTILDIYCKYLQEYDAVIQNIISKKAFEAMEQGVNLDISRLHGTEATKYGGLMSEVFQKWWRRDLDDHAVLKRVLNWPPFAHYVETFYLQDMSQMLNQECNFSLVKAASLIQDVLKKLMNGSIVTKDLNTVLENKESFIHLMRVMQRKGSNVNELHIEKTLKIRVKEKEAFELTVDQVTKFVNMCQLFDVDTHRLDVWFCKLEDRDRLAVSEICRPGKIEEIKDENEYIPTVIAFGLTEEMREILPELCRCSNSNIFTKMWQKTGSKEAKNKGSSLSEQEVVEAVWENTYSKWNDLCKRLQTGDILVTEFNKYFRGMEDGIIGTELLHMSRGTDTSWVANRIEQIHQHKTLTDCVNGARVILQVVKTYELKGDFGVIDHILSLAHGEDTPLKNIDKSLIDTCSALHKFNDEQVNCLKVFINCKKLIDWLREAMPTGMKELKVFVDLASISAGESAMDIGKVNCLHSATTGYAPLIFDLKEDTDYHTLLERCEIVWKELKADPKLPTKLIDTNREIAWLMIVKKAHGSIEVTSLSQAEAINSAGIYHVGNLRELPVVRTSDLNDVMLLHVPEDEGKTRLRKKYNHDKLHDLQSRLMLIAGGAEKGKEEVDRFMLILDPVIRLSNVYIKLTAAGCVLFTNWNVKFYCDPKRPVCAEVIFGCGRDTQKLKGRKENEESDVSALIPKLAEFMEDCLEKWLDYISEKRSQYYHLNYFTIDQMVILQRELVKVGKQNGPSDAIYPLLSAVKHGCSKQDLISAMEEAKKEVQEMDKQNQQDSDDDDDDDEGVMTGESSTYTADDIENFIKEMKREGFDENLAQAALKHVSPKEIDRGVTWCMQNDMETQDDTGENDVMETEASSFPGWTDSDKSIMSVTKELLQKLSVIEKDAVKVDPLIEGLCTLWKTFLSSISSSVSDYLSVEHLGLILKHLAEKETFEVNRAFFFKPGQPNLIVCPQGDILNMVVSIYALASEQPLPQSDEVLMCSQDTTVDQLDIFWRRAVFDTSKRIHCLVNADLLNYEVSDKGMGKLERQIELASLLSGFDQFRLIVICSSENEYKSRVAAALDKYKQPPLPIKPTKELKVYLSEKLKIETVHGNVRPASLIDPDQSSVRIVKSWRSGVGKTLYVKRQEQRLSQSNKGIRKHTKHMITVPLHDKHIDVDAVMKVLLSKENSLPHGEVKPRIIHIDIYHEVQEGVDDFLFNLLVLECLTDSDGYVWRKAPQDLYMIETMPLLAKDPTKDGQLICFHKCLNILPDIVCRSPQESLDILKNGKRPIDYSENDLLFDNTEFTSTVFQRPYQYLKRQNEGRDFADVNPVNPEGTHVDCLQMLLRYCGVEKPSWAELRNFVWFLNTQLLDFEVSSFCGKVAEEDLPGFSKFVLRFLIQMSRDFATRSLKMSEESPIQMIYNITEDDQEEDTEADLQQYEMRRTWESSPHPYLFFNPDHHSMTFLGFNIDAQTGNLIDHQSGQVLESNIAQKTLQDGLRRNKVNLNENFDVFPRCEKILKLCSVMGVEMVHDPDETYELTTDNVKKMLAIYMRFRCDIPVIIMGETGCGKTRLVKYMCSLQCPPGADVQNMILMKVHGGTKTTDIIKKVHAAEKVAQKNLDAYGPHMYTVLFFDEANTTEAIGLIKEIMCDKTIGGEPLKLCKSLKIVAACNPYRKHSDELIEKLEKAGLGYHVHKDKTTDRLGRVPMRRLVYRVQPLPQSLLPLVWDFGQLNTDIEERYIRQMVLRYIRADKLPGIPGLENVVSRIITASQGFMRQQQDECSFVSLRDVERVLEVMSWFYHQSSQQEGHTRLFEEMTRKLTEGMNDEFEGDEDEQVDNKQNREITDGVTVSLVLALGVCYHACLKKREEYRQEVAQYFTSPCALRGGADEMLKIIERCQEVFLDNVDLGENIAKNQALKENVFMMVTCIELRIPLFLVGKPGSSKSLAKTIVADAMQGNAAHKDLFKEYKQVHMVSFQCSPLSTPELIVATFNQCGQFQREKDLSRFVSVVVLDEVGLAEDSPKMPLKTLHPLLEDGCHGDEEPQPYQKVAFIGISNWALDPAKMNRGILVQRLVPQMKELKDSAAGICRSDEVVYRLIKPIIPSLASSYLALFEKAQDISREFFGLRDFYSLLKMVYAFAAKRKTQPTWRQLKHAIRRNFGGLDNIDPVKEFSPHLKSFVNQQEPQQPNDPDSSSAGLIEACLSWENHDTSESRYLLLLTENYGALSILQQKILTIHNAITIFGSSFPSDQEYTQICRNINRIKVCMETGNTVVLLNLENLYESLYDALNQYYVYLGGEQYVDLGLGTQRLKCRVHKDFRLIVVAEKKIVYEKFPIPLINRLEKHFLTVSTMLTPPQQELTRMLESWAHDFVTVKKLGFGGKTSSFSVEDVFMGYNADTCAAIVLHVTGKQSISQNNKDQIFSDAKELLLWCATPDAVLRLESTPLDKEADSIADLYFKQQKHESLLHYLLQKITVIGAESLIAQITTHYKLISSSYNEDLSRTLDIPVDNIDILTLQSFDTEQQFFTKIKNIFNANRTVESLLMIQCDSGDQNGSLIACARYCIQDALHQLKDEMISQTHVVFVIQLPRGGYFSGFQCGLWHTAHIDELCPPDIHAPTILDMRSKSVGKLLKDAVSKTSVTDQIATVNDKEDMEWEADKRPNQNLDYASHQAMEIKDADTQNDEELYLNDIVLMDSQNENWQNDGSERKFDVQNLILSCVHSALALVKDTEKDSLRTTKRVEIVLKLLQQQSFTEDTFVKGLSTHLAVILAEKEEKFSGSEMASKWLSEEAAKAENINKAGSFRRSWMQNLEMKIRPILAGIIAHFDTNRNLDILATSAHEEWCHLLWLNIANDLKVTQIHYASLLSPTQSHSLEEVVVKHTDVNGHGFTSQMPFSWLIYKHIEDVYKTVLSTDSSLDVSSLVRRVTEIVQETPLGQIIQSRLHSDIRQASRAYLYDFVHMVYPSKSEEEQRLVCESVVIATNVQITEESQSPVGWLVRYHIIYSHISMRLKNFSGITAVWPECTSAIIESQQKSQQFYLITHDEMTLDVLGLHLLLDQLKPVGDTLNETSGRQDWLNKVRTYRPVVERILGYFHEEHKSEDSGKNRRCMKGIQDARHQWTRVVVVKLFIEHVCSVESKDTRRCMPLWMIMEDDADMKTITSLKNLETFLHKCNREAIAKHFGEQKKCPHCERDIEGRPVVLPCKPKHVVCSGCYKEMKIIQESQQKCPVCQEDVPNDFDPYKSDEISRKVKLYKEYQSRCNSFFMDIVSQLCFADETAPSEEVINKLLKYITHETRKTGKVVSKELTIFDDCIDTTPVVRSFLLQLLIRTSSQQVDAYLEKYIQETVRLFGDQGGDQHVSQIIELALLILQCLEDFHHHKTSKTQNTQDFTEVKHATTCLKDAKEHMMDSELTLQKLHSIAKARFGLTIVAKYMHLLVIKKSVDMTRDIRKLIDSAADLCEDSRTRWPRIFFIKHLCRLYGIEKYQAICRKSDAHILRWINLQELAEKEIHECSDRYIVCGDIYQNIRESITKAALEEDIVHLQGIVDGMNANDWKTKIQLVLALHREVTMSNVYPKNRQRVSMEKITKLLLELTSKHPTLRSEAAMLQAIINNEFWQTLNIKQGMDLKDQNIICLLMHAAITFNLLPGQRAFLQPFIRLSNQPHAMSSSFLPAMPHDDVTEIRDVLLDNRGSDPNIVIYRCPNGHAYSIGDCGRPYYLGVCPECGAQIGGKNHQPAAGNIKDSGEDRTERGHILGRAQNRSRISESERQLTPIQCTITRLLLHLSMYIGANSDKVAVCNLIKPDITVNDVGQFLWDHIETDVDILHRLMGRSADDIYLLIHNILKVMMESHNPGETLQEDMCSLESKASRQEWELEFTKRILNPLLQDLDQTMTDCNQKVIHDQRLGSDPLLCLLYETDTPSGQTILYAIDTPSGQTNIDLHNNPAVWRYRSQISIDNLSQAFDSQMMKGKHKILELFLKNDHHLRAVRFVPAIVRLQKILIQRYQMKLDLSEASSITVSELKEEIKKEGGIEDFDGLMNEVSTAWDSIRGTLTNYSYRTEGGIRLKVPKRYCRQEINDATSIAVLLPTLKDAGLCSYFLLRFLLETHNSFLRQYCEDRKINFDELPRITLKEITPGHLICYNPEQDILPLVLANCGYSFEVGKGTKIEYNFTNIERQLTDRFFFSKSVIDIDEMPLMTYRYEVTNAVVFESLRDKIKQEPLSTAVCHEIQRELHFLPDLCDCLDKLDIAISFLKSVGGDADLLLDHFMSRILKMENPIPSQKVRQSCSCRHIQSLWITLALAKTKLLASSGKNSFENIPEEMKVELSDEHKEILKEFCKDLSFERVDMILLSMFECIVLRIATPQNPEDGTDFLGYGLMETLYYYIESPLYNEDVHQPEWMLQLIQNYTKDDPNNILCRHSVESWLYMYNISCQKLQERN